MKKFKIKFHYNGIENINLGISINLLLPNMELHVPFGFFRIGMTTFYNKEKGIFEFSSYKQVMKHNKLVMKERRLTKGS